MAHPFGDVGAQLSLVRVSTLLSGSKTLTRPQKPILVDTCQSSFSVDGRSTNWENRHAACLRLDGGRSSISSPRTSSPLVSDV
jgi:hypothetical protein